MRVIIASLKLLMFAFVCIFTLIMQGIGQFVFRNTRLYLFFPRLFGQLTISIFRIKVTIVGKISDKDHVIFLGNHVSYIDIPVLGAHLNAIFIAKGDVRNWPVFGILGKIAGTIFIGRNRGAVTQATKDIGQALQAGRSLIIFPEGTSTQGVKVLPFKSSLFELFLNESLKDRIIVQPFTLSIQSTNGAPIQTPDDQDLYAWHSDMTLPPHLWQIAKSKGAHIQLEFHETHNANDFNNRKDFALACHTDVELGLEKARALP